MVTPHTSWLCSLRTGHCARRLSCGHDENDISKAAAVVLISKWHQRFEVFLQVRSVVFDRFVLAPRVAFAVIALHFFGCSVVSVSVEVKRHKCDPAAANLSDSARIAAFAAACPGSRAWLLFC